MSSKFPEAMFLFVFFYYINAEYVLEIYNYLKLNELLKSTLL